MVLEQEQVAQPVVGPRARGSQEGAAAAAAFQPFAWSSLS